VRHATINLSVTVVEIYVGFFKNFFGKVFGWGNSAAQTRRRDDFVQSNEDGKRIVDASSLRDVSGSFNLKWSISRDSNDESVLYFELTPGDGTILHREQAVYGDLMRAEKLVSMLHEKYRERLLELYLAPGVGVYIVGDDDSDWNKFVQHVQNCGYEHVVPELESVKRDGATREIFVSDTVFRLKK
jgi:hypothetical protein